MLLFREFLINSQSLFQQRLSFFILALDTIEIDQIMKNVDGTRVLSTQSFFFDSQSTLEQRLGLFVISLDAREICQSIQDLCCVGMFMAQPLFIHFQGTPEEGIGFFKFSLLISKEPLLVDNVSNRKVFMIFM